MDEALETMRLEVEKRLRPMGARERDRWDLMLVLGRPMWFNGGMWRLNKLVQKLPKWVYEHGIESACARFYSSIKPDGTLLTDGGCARKC